MTFLWLSSVSKLGYISRPSHRLYTRCLYHLPYSNESTTKEGKRMHGRSSKHNSLSLSPTLVLAAKTGQMNTVFLLELTNCRSLHTSHFLHFSSVPNGPGTTPTTGTSTPPTLPPPKPGDLPTTPPLPGNKPAQNSMGKIKDQHEQEKILAELTAAADQLDRNESRDVVEPPKKTILQRIKSEILHYYHGFRLLYLDFKIAIRLTFKLTQGDALTRRERKQLVRTVADLVRLVPFLIFVIIPFMEFLLPFYIKFFPFMLPSTFQEEAKEKERVRQILKGKLEMAKFFQDTLAETTGVKKRVKDSPSVGEFKGFLKRVRESGQMAETKDILRFSRLFEDEVTLDSLDYKTLQGLCKFLELNSIGPGQLLRFLIRMRMRQLKVDDKMIASEGLDKLAMWELQTLCRERGMRALGMSEERLRSQLGQWLDLHLKQNVPLTLLLLSRTMYLPESFTSEEQIKQAIGKLSDSVSKEAALKVSESGARVDYKTKIEVLKQEEDRLKQEQKERDAEKKAKEVLVDKAPVVQAKPEEELEPTPKVAEPATPTAAPLVEQEVPSPPEPAMEPLEFTPRPTPESAPLSLITSPELEPEITASDLAQIESAIESLEETKTALDEEELDDLKEDVAELHALQLGEVVTTGDQDKVGKVAARLGDKVDRMIKDMDKMIDNLHEEKKDLMKDIEVKEVYARHQSEEEAHAALVDEIQTTKERVIDINDLMLSLRRIQKVPDDTKWQRILDVLDEDHDGKIELSHVLEVIEMLGSENVKLSRQEITRVLDVVEKEAQAALKEANNSNNNVEPVAKDADPVAKETKDTAISLDEETKDEAPKK